MAKKNELTPSFVMDINVCKYAKKINIRLAPKKINYCFKVMKKINYRRVKPYPPPPGFNGGAPLGRYCSLVKQCNLGIKACINYLKCYLPIVHTMHADVVPVKSPE